MDMRQKIMMDMSKMEVKLFRLASSVNLTRIVAYTIPPRCLGMLVQSVPKSSAFTLKGERLAGTEGRDRPTDVAVPSITGRILDLTVAEVMV